MSFCLICYKNCDNLKIYNETKAKVKSDIKRFLKILERYINGGKGEGSSSTKFSPESGMTCPNCHNLTEEFCDIYYILEETEMILNWKLKCLLGIMEDNNLLERLQTSNDLGTGADEAMEWRRIIISKCNEKSQRAFPKLILKRHIDANNKTWMEGVRTKPQLSFEEVDDGNGQIEITAEEEPQTIIGNTQTGDLASQIVDVSQERNSSQVSAKEIEGADDTFGNEQAYSFYEEDDFDPGQLSSESSSDSDNDVENIKELKFEGFITELPQIILDDDIKEIKHLTVNCKTETKSGQGNNASHQATENVEDSLNCKHCGKLFANKMSLSMHEWLHGKKFICKSCNEVFKCQTDLNMHVLMHNSGGSPKKLNQNRFSQVSQSRLDQIKKTKSNNYGIVINGQRRYPCGVCGRIFNRGDHRKRHCKRFHNGLGILNEKLEEHKKTHGNENLNRKRQILAQARTELAQAKQSLQPSQIQKAQHMHNSIVVNGQRRYPCGVCDKLFNHRSNRSRHCRRLHNGAGKELLPTPSQNEQSSVPAKNVQKPQQPPITQHSNTIIEDNNNPTIDNRNLIESASTSNFEKSRQEEIEQFDNEQISSSPAAADGSWLPKHHSGEDDQLANDPDSSSTSPEAVIEETPQNLLHNMEGDNDGSNAVSQFQAEDNPQALNLTNSSPVINHEGMETASRVSRQLRNIHSCPICSKTFSKAQKLQAHLTSHLSDEEESLQLDKIIDNAQEKDCDEYNPDELSIDESESSSSSSEIESDSNEYNDQKDTEEETDEAVSPNRTRLGKKSLDILRKRYAADSEIVEFITLPCKIEGCNKILRNPRDFEDHKGHHGTFSCSLCPTTFDYAPVLARHELSKHCKENAKCPREGCDFKGTSNLQYEHHVLVSHLNLKLSIHGRKFNCKICKHGFGKMWELRRHFPLCRIPKVSTTKKIKCDVEGCRKTFHNAAGLWSHKYLMHSETNLVCQTCKKTFANKVYLNNHIRNMHQKDLTIICVVESCKEKFISELSLDSHVLAKHKNDKDKITKQCHHCGNKYVGSWNLKKHLESHGRPKLNRHICKTCGKSFKTREKLGTHKLAHSGPESWQYQCKICAKKCMSKQKLEEHKRTHGNEKPFVCDICGAKYAHRHNLRIHLNKKHGHLTKDVAKVYERINSSSRKGVKRKKVVMDEEVETPSSSDSDSSN